QASDLCFPTVAAPVSTCQYTMVPLQGLALVGHCPLDSHMMPPRSVYPANGEYIQNGKAQHCLAGLQQDEVDCDLECDTLLPQTNGLYQYSSRETDHQEQNHSTHQLLPSSLQFVSSQEVGDKVGFDDVAPEISQSKHGFF
ncbi:hypothetical protein XENOCAPTIV_010309, partial [Xenoophorus captivus]